MQYENLVYLISCKKCGLQYVGETENTLHMRMKRHRSDIKTRKTEKPVAAHIFQPDHIVKWGGSRRSTGAAHSEEERERASGSSPSERCLHTGWFCMSDIMPYTVTTYGIIVDANTAYATNIWLYPVFFVFKQ